MILRPLLCGLLALLLTACATPAAPPVSTSPSREASEPPLHELLARAATPQKEPERDEQPEPLSGWSGSGHYRTTGTASWLSRSLDGRRTASGEVMNSHRFTAAHRTLPLGSYVRVTNLGNGRQVIVKINDRGPFNRHLLIDVTHAAASELGMVRSGKARVRIESVSRATARAEAKPVSQTAQATQPPQHTAPVKGKRIQVASGANKEKLVAEGKRLQARLGLPYQVRGQGRLYRLILGPVASQAQQRELKHVKNAGYPQAFLIN